MVDVFGIKGFFAEIEVEECHGVDVLELEIPFVSFSRLFANGESGIEKRAVLEVLLVGILHFHYELFSVLVFAIHVKYGFALGIDIADVLAVEVGHVANDLLTIEKRVEKVDEQVFVGRSAEYPFEPEVGEQTDVAFFRL